MATLFTPSGGVLNGDDNNPNATFRIGCTLAAASNGSIRVTFTAASATGLTVGHASIGKASGIGGSSDCTTVPLELKFAGASGFAISAGQSITSDFLVHSGSFSLAAADTLVVIHDVTSPSGQRFRGSLSNVTGYWKNGTTSWNTQTLVGESSLGALDYDVERIETNDLGGSLLYVPSPMQHLLVR